jgi:hypothetical protein
MGWSQLPYRHRYHKLNKLVWDEEVSQSVDLWDNELEVVMVSLSGI